MMDDKPMVALAQPRRGGMIADGSARGLYVYPTTGKCLCIPYWSSTSLLDHCFNMLWTRLHNMRRTGHNFTYWAILHDDVSPEPGWVDTLMGELETHDADFIQALVPIKSDKGLTSTAIATSDPWVSRRITMHEAYQLPETFGPDDVGGPLQLNTGCCLLRLRGPWLENPEQFYFDSLKRIAKTVDGDLVADVVSEDWFFTSLLQKAGAKVLVTRKVGLTHAGDKEYDNASAWGAWQTDTAFWDRSGKTPEPIGEAICV
jgi:hypothetical protein